MANMKIDEIIVKNYRTLHDCSIRFPDYYTALSGKNNTGKTSILKAIRLFFMEEDDFDPFAIEAPSVSYKSDYPLWKRTDEQKEPIQFKLKLLVYRDKDAGLFKFVETFLSFCCEGDNIVLELGIEYNGSSEPQLSLACSGKAETDHFKIQEIHKRIKKSNAFFFHNSTEPKHRYYLRHNLWSFFGSVPNEDKDKLKQAKDALFKRMKSVATRHKEEITQLLGRLDEKYEVSISLPTVDLENFPFILSLGDKKENIPLSDWGSGTQNRTHILMGLLRAKKIREVASESDKITPIMIIEEPESFLHPSAQSEFGRVLRDLVHEFEVQVIATTHSPHMLSVDRPDSNILLNRRSERNKLYETYVENTDTKDWMHPFALSLGLTPDIFLPWKSVLFTESKEILLVEGEIDKDYFVELRRPEHAASTLNLEGDIFCYGGDGFFSHDVMVKFICERFARVIITYDLDAENKVIKKLEGLGLKKNEDFIAIGINQNGKRNIEGLLPTHIISAVASKEPELLNLAASKDEGSNDARQRLKRIKQREFFATAKPQTEDYAEFYKVTNLINAALRKKRR